MKSPVHPFLMMVNEKIIASGADLSTVGGRCRPRVNPKTWEKWLRGEGQAGFRRVRQMDLSVDIDLAIQKLAAAIAKPKTT